MPYVITVPDSMVPASVRKKKPAKHAQKHAQKKPPNAWAQFCKAHMHDKRVQAVPPRQRFGVLSKMYKARQQ